MQVFRSTFLWNLLWDSSVITRAGMAYVSCMELCLTSFADFFILPSLSEVILYPFHCPWFCILWLSTHDNKHYQFSQSPLILKTCLDSQIFKKCDIFFICDPNFLTLQYRDISDTGRCTGWLNTIVGNAWWKSLGQSFPAINVSQQRMCQWDCGYRGTGPYSNHVNN